MVCQWFNSATPTKSELERGGLSSSSACTQSMALKSGLRNGWSNTDFSHAARFKRRVDLSSNSILRYIVCGVQMDL